MLRPGLRVNSIMRPSVRYRSLMAVMCDDDDVMPDFRTYDTYLTTTSLDVEVRPCASCLLTETTKVSHHLSQCIQRELSSYAVSGG